MGIPAQKSELGARLNVDKSVERLSLFFGTYVEFVGVLAKASACYYLNQFTQVI